MSLLHQLRGLAEVGVRAGGIHHGVDFALTDDGAGIDRAAGLCGDGQRLASQSGLIHLN